MIVFAMGFSTFAEKVIVLLGMWVDCSSSSSSCSLYFLLFLGPVSPFWHAILIWGSKQYVVCYFFVGQCTCVCKWEMCEWLQSEVWACSHVLCTLVCAWRCVAFTHGRSYFYLNSTRVSDTCAGQMPRDTSGFLLRGVLFALQDLCQMWHQLSHG